MAPQHKAGRGGGHGRGGKKKGKRMDDSEMVRLLEERIAAETPAPGTNPLADRMSTAQPVLRRFDQVHYHPPGVALSWYATAI